jgi:hypothetical protein
MDSLSASVWQVGLAMARKSVNPYHSSVRDLQNESSSGPCGCVDTSRREAEVPHFATHSSRDWLTHHGAANKSVHPQEEG